MEPIQLTRARGALVLRLTCVALGRDLSVTLSGGDRGHLGAVALSQPRPSHREGGGVSATTSVLTILGHKEDELARALGAELASRLDTVVCVACGIHVDGLGPEGLAEILAMAGELKEELAQRLLAARHGMLSK